MGRRWDRHTPLPPVAPRSVLAPYNPAVPRLIIISRFIPRAGALRGYRVPRGYRGSGPMVFGVLRVGAGVLLDYPRVGYARGFDPGFGPLQPSQLAPMVSVSQSVYYSG